MQPILWVSVPLAAETRGPGLGEQHTLVLMSAGWKPEVGMPGWGAPGGSPPEGRWPPSHGRQRPASLGDSSRGAGPSPEGPDVLPLDTL